MIRIAANSYFDRMRIDAVRVESGRFPQEGVNGLGPGDAEQCPDAARMELLHLGLELLRLVEHQIHIRHVARQMAFGVVVAQLFCMSNEVRTHFI